MLEKNLFVVKEKAKFFSSNGSYEILDETGAVTGTAEQKTGFLAKLLGSATGAPPTRIEFRQKPGDALVFAVRRRGYLLKKIEVVNAENHLVGRYKAKMFSLSGGFHIYDANGKHIAEIRGKLLKADFTFFAPDGKTEMGKVAKKWGGLARELFTSADTYAVQVAPAFSDDKTAKMLILGAAVAIDALMAKSGGAAKTKGKGDESDSDE